MTLRRRLAVGVTAYAVVASAVALGAYLLLYGDRVVTGATTLSTEGSAVKAVLVPGRPEVLGVRIGEAPSLFPGDTVAVPVTYTNPKPFAVVVTAVQVSSGGVSGCGTEYLVAGSHGDTEGPVVPGRGGTAAGSVPFGLSTDAPEACQGAVLPVTVTASAVRR